VAEEEDQSISRETIFTVLANDADGYYKLVLTVASAFLGGSLLFLEKIVPHPTRLSLVLMTLGWLSLVASIAAITSVRQRNLRSGFLALEGKVDEARKLDVAKDRHSGWAAWLLIVGMSFIVLAGAVGIWTKTFGGH
jgi:hypothetical protein